MASERSGVQSSFHEELPDGVAAARLVTTPGKGDGTPGVRFRIENCGEVQVRVGLDFAVEVEVAAVWRAVPSEQFEATPLVAQLIPPGESGEEQHWTAAASAPDGRYRVVKKVSFVSDGVDTSAVLRTEFTLP